MYARIKAVEADGIRIQVDINIGTKGLEIWEEYRLLRQCVRNIARTFEILLFSDFGVENIETELHPDQKPKFE